jgi:MFS family permease
VFLTAFALPRTTLFGGESALTGSVALTLPLVVLVVARALDGLTGGNVSVASAYLADISTNETRAENFGRLAGSSNLGFVAGPAIAGGSMALAAGFWLYQSTGTALLYLAAVLMAVGNGLMWPSLQAALARISGKTYQGAVQGLAGSLGAVASIAGLVVGGVLYASVGAGVFQLSTAIIVAVSVLSLALPRDERSGSVSSSVEKKS